MTLGLKHSKKHDSHKHDKHDHADRDEEHGRVGGRHQRDDDKGHRGGPDKKAASNCGPDKPDPVDPTDPSGPVDPVDPTDPTDPTDPADPSVSEAVELGDGTDATFTVGTPAEFDGTTSTLSASFTIGVAARRTMSSSSPISREAHGTRSTAIPSATSTAIAGPTRSSTRKSHP